MKRTLSSNVYSVNAGLKLSAFSILASAATISIAVSPALSIGSQSLGGESLYNKSRANKYRSNQSRSNKSVPSESAVVKPLLAQTSSSTAITEQAAVRPKEWKFQNEQEWIVDSTGHDVAEMLGYAKYWKSDSKFAVKDLDFKTTTVDLGSNSYSFTYSFKGEPASDYKFNLQEYAWSPKNYEPLAQQLIEKFKLTATAPSTVPDDFMKNIAQANFESLFKENNRLSEALSQNPLDPSLHEQAAMLQAVFNMMENCGMFSDTRAPLSRISAHLSIAKALNSDKLSSVGQIANIALESMSCRDGVAIPMIEAAEKQQFTAAEKSILRALKIRGTANWRYYIEAEATPLEENQYGMRFSQTRPIEETMNTMMEKHGSLPIQWMRILNSGRPSVQTGHVIQAGIVSAELRDFVKSYNAFKGTSREDVQNLVPELNLESTRCFTADSGAQPLTVLSWADVAAFHSRHIAQALSSEYMFNARMYGVDQLAKQTAARAKSLFSSLNIFPLIAVRFDMEGAERDKALADFKNMVVNHPELATSYNWTTVTDTAEKLAPQSNILPAELWFNPPMPMGTAFYYCPALKNNKPDLAQLTELKKLAPYMPIIAMDWLEKKYGKDPTSDQIREAFGPLAEFDVHAMQMIADGEIGNPDKYIPLTEKVAEEDPGQYSSLGWYCVIHERPEQASKYFEKMVTADENAVRVANSSDWLIRYREEHGQKDKAKELADFSAEVYSNSGLQSQARYFERHGDLKAAEQNYRKIVDRYNSDAFLCAFLLRNKDKNAAYGAEGAQIAKKYYPNGMKQVTLADFKTKPSTGLKITVASYLLDDPVVKKDNVVVAINGYAVNNKAQADIARNMATLPVASMIVWTGNAYKEIKRKTVHNNMLSIAYEPLVSESPIEKANKQKATQTLTDLKDNMMKQAAELQKQNLPPEEMLKRLFQQNNIPSSMYQNLLQQKTGKSAEGNKTPRQSKPSAPVKKR